MTIAPSTFDRKLAVLRQTNFAQQQRRRVRKILVEHRGKPLDLPRLQAAVFAEPAFNLFPLKHRAVLHALLSEIVFSEIVSARSFHELGHA